MQLQRTFGFAAIAVAVAWSMTGRAADDFKAEDGYIVLFNGKDLTGWEYKGSKEALEGKTETADKRFQVIDGLIVANDKDAQGKGGIRDLYTLKQFDKAFNLKLEFRASPKSDSGVYLRGPQLQIRDFIRRNEMKQLKKFKNDDWNELDITLRDGVVSTTVNGKEIGESDVLELTVKNGKPEAKLNGKPVDVNNIQVSVAASALCLLNGEVLDKGFKVAAKKGGIGVQAETGKFEYRRIRIKELP